MRAASLAGIVGSGGSMTAFLGGDVGFDAEDAFGRISAADEEQRDERRIENGFVVHEWVSLERGVTCDSA